MSRWSSKTYALYVHMTVRANMGFGLKMAGMPKREICTRVSQANGFTRRPVLGGLINEYEDAA